LTLQAERDLAENEAEKANAERAQELAPAERLLEVRADDGEPEALLELGERLLDSERAR
jgi:hypothetical protein